MAEPRKLPAHNGLAAPIPGGIAARAMAARGAAYLSDLNPEQREAVKLWTAPCWFWPAPEPEKPVCYNA